MRKAILTVFIISWALISEGQTVTPATVNNVPGHDAKSTTGGGRWYDYCLDWLQPFEQSFGQDVHSFVYDLWNDTTAVMGCTGTAPMYRRDTLLSVGMQLAPVENNCYFWNHMGMFPGQMRVRTADPYTADSIKIAGWYTRTFSSPAKDSVTDTLIVAFVYGDNTATSDLWHDTLGGSIVPVYCAGCTQVNLVGLYHDAANNRAAHYGGAPLPGVQVYKFLLKKDDTTTNPMRGTTYPRPGHIPADPVITFPVPADNMVAATVSFKSGDTSYHPTGGPGDTVRYSNGTSITGVKHNYWQAQVYAATSSPTSTTPLFTWYDSSFHSDGYFAFAGGRWGTGSATYQTTYELVNSHTPLAASASQYPHIAFHLVCPTCPTVTSCTTEEPEIAGGKDEVLVNPNPADGQLSFTAAPDANGAVRLTDMCGRMVAEVQLANGKAAMNTSRLPGGMYMYKVDGTRGTKTGRVLVVH